MSHHLYIVLLVTNCLVCLGLFLTSCSRVLKMDDDTRPEIRFATIMLGVCAMAVGISPFVPQWYVVLSWPQVALEAAILLVQFVTGRLWSRGAPRVFQVDQRRMHRA